MSDEFSQRIADSLLQFIDSPGAYLEEVRKTGNDRLCALGPPQFRTKKVQVKIRMTYGCPELAVAHGMSNEMVRQVFGKDAQVLYRSASGVSFRVGTDRETRALVRKLSSTCSTRRFSYRTNHETYTINIETPVYPPQSKLSTMYRARKKLAELSNTKTLEVYHG